MTERVWRQLLAEVERPRTAAQDSVIRMAIAMIAADIHAPIAPKDRAQLLAYLQKAEMYDEPLTPAQKAWVKERLFPYIKERHGRIYDIVEKQFR